MQALDAPQQLVVRPLLPLHRGREPALVAEVHGGEGQQLAAGEAGLRLLARCAGRARSVQAAAFRIF